MAKKAEWKKVLMIVRMIISILLIAIAVIIVLFGLLYAFHGSFEAFPTDEQQEKARIASVFIMVLGSMIGLFGICIKPKKR